jgi:triosephosphate isomerase
MKRIVLANWKMNLTLPEAIALAQGSVKAAEEHSQLQVVIAPSLPFLVSVREELRHLPPNFALASQVVSQYAEGAYTGDVAAMQLKGLVTYCLVGHSERRRYHHENGSVISEQIKLLLNNHITPVVCFGEMSQSTQKTFSPQITLDLGNDLHGLDKEEIQKCLFAYEPLWAIGTGHPATPEYAKKAVMHVKEWFKEKYNEVPAVLYGGSVSEDNAEALGEIRELDGLLVGGASLHTRSFQAICTRFSGHA